MRTINIEQKEREGSLHRFSSLSLARDFRDRAETIALILQGDDMRYWVVLGGLASALEKGGYEIVK